MASCLHAASVCDTYWEASRRETRDGAAAGCKDAHIKPTHNILMHEFLKMNRKRKYAHTCGLTLADCDRKILVSPPH